MTWWKLVSVSPVRTRLGSQRPRNTESLPATNSQRSSSALTFLLLQNLRCGGKPGKNETTKRDSPHGILCGDLSGLDRSSRHIDEEQLFSCNLIRWERTSWNWKAESICCCRRRKEGGREGGEIKKNGEMPRSEESWLFVKDSDRKRPRQAKLIDGCWQVPDVGFYNIVSLSH